MKNNNIDLFPNTNNVLILKPQIMKKTILLIMISMIGFISYGNNSTDEKMNEVEKLVKSTLLDKKGLSVDVNIIELNVFYPVMVTISVDCDGDGIWDYIYQGTLDSSHVDAMVAQLVGSC